MNSIAVQENTLKALLKQAKHTQIGRKYSFNDIKTVEQYQLRVPLMWYEDFWNEWLKDDFPHIKDKIWPGKIKNFVLSSGTSAGSTKYIPFTRDMLISNRKAGMDMLCWYLYHNPHSKVLDGKNFVLLGSGELKSLENGIMAGDLSDTMMLNLPWWIKGKHYPSGRAFGITNWEERINYLVEDSIKYDIRSISGVPSWMVIFFDKLFEAYSSKRTLSDIYPHLELIIHGGTHFEPYKELFERYIDDRITLWEVYPASEGFIGIQDRGTGEGLRLNCDLGIFYEFVRLDELNTPSPNRYWLANCEKDIDYAIVLTTNAGLWSYILGDVIRFVDLDPPRLRISGRTSGFLSAFGEHLTEYEIVNAVTQGCEECNLPLLEFTVYPVYPKEKGEVGYHKYIIEIDRDSVDSNIPDRLADAIDAILCKSNEDYKAHRAKGFGMKKPTVRLVPSGVFKAWMKHRGKLGGQNKIPRVITKGKIIEDLEDFLTHLKNRDISMH